MKALILNNIGTPEGFDTEAVRDYLNEFLMDPDIISLPKPLRWLLVKKLIVPRRGSQSAAKYRKVWMPEGSPLMVWSRRFARSLASELGAEWRVELGMRYGHPGTREVLEELRGDGVTEVYFAPMYPQWAKATTESGVSELRRSLKSMGWDVPARVLKPFFHEAGFVEAIAGTIKPRLKPGDHLLFSYHGLPESQVNETPGCLREPSCCERALEPGFRCYRAHCLRNSREIARELGWPEDSWSSAFQSRLGPAKWIGPSTDDVLRELAARGKSVVVVCPSFVVDCLETLEEIGLEGRKEYLQAGGSSYELVPCLNDDASWVRAFADITRREASWSSAVRS
jgi:ferrochelatase